MLSSIVKGGTTYTYAHDSNGNVTTDGIRGMTITYNYLNLPKSVAKGADNLEFIYDATGVRLATKQNGTTQNYYTGAVVYKSDKTPDYILTSSGMIRKDGANYIRQYNITDHLGNVRSVVNQSGTIEQATDYYPYGLSFSNNNLTKNRYLYNGKEIQNQTLSSQFFGVYDYGARYYDPVIGRWHVIDPLAADYDNLSPYGYCVGNPIKYIDINGEFIGTIIGTVVGGVAGAYDSYKKGGDVWAGAAEGAVSGAIAGAAVDLAVAATVATGGGALVVIGAGAAAGAIGGAAGAVVGDATGQLVTSVNKGSSISNAVSNINTTNMADKAKTGAVTGAIGGATGGAVGKGLQAVSNSTKVVQGTMSKNITETAKTLTKMGADEKTMGTAVNKITTGMGEAGRNTVKTTNKVAAGTGMATESAIKVGQMQKEEKK